MNKLMIPGVALMVCLGFAAESQARPRVSVSFGFSLPSVVVTNGCVSAMPLPAPVVYAPASVVYAPAPQPVAVYQPVAVTYPAPVVVAPAPVAVYQPAVVCAPAPAMVIYRPAYIEPRHDWHDHGFRYEHRR